VELTYFIIKDDLYIGGGIRAINNEVLEYTDFWSYDLIDKYWIRRKSIPFRNIFPTTLSCSSDQSGFVYLFDNTFWAYDPTNNSWSVKAEFPGPDRCYGNIVYLNNRVYLIGSAYYDILLQGLKDCWEYDISSGSWQLSSFVPSYSNRGFAGTYRNSLITGLGYAPLGRVDFYEPNLYIMTP